MKTLSRMLLLSGVGLCLAILASPVDACHLCQNRCAGFGSHYDACDIADLGWSGGCVGGCKPWSDCSIHVMNCAGGCVMTPDAVRSMVGGRDWEGLAVAAVERQIRVEGEIGMIYVLSCRGDQVLAQVPIGIEAAGNVLVDMNAYRLDLLVDM